MWRRAERAACPRDMLVPTAGLERTGGPTSPAKSASTNFATLGSSYGLRAHFSGVRQANPVNQRRLAPNK